ncbi:Peptidase M16C associated domain protein [Alkaliphilus metalliredigens QYMF]|uniref:Peptidase M16C associated domain protein n=1 Tax=Alkaliphilus metalliredigens (strain QYMF) TaxID=293826 RepID=A6TM53_ALKMQ|nr:insulinase family protein [Alkaliphilus metalliredigens]ABR47271.1 Peptidase M16C associated domain protein [Alkaliphilus metalliredigens QYMF]
MEKMLKAIGLQRNIAWILLLAMVLSFVPIQVHAEQGYEVNKVYNGFQLMEEKYVEEIDSQARLFQHMQSGAQLIHLDNDDSNKVLSISFSTPPSDDTGIPHILEHSVLNGSEKFPVKSPFIEMNKRSLNTFLNAFTYPEHTSYVAASRNDRDFRNLLDMYLDAVFAPKVLKEEKIFMQEGWHFALKNFQDELIYNGVVYNEMKGVYSNPFSVLSRENQKSLFPDTPRAYNSGGVPEMIPQLSYEALIDFYDTYYHPSNSYIYLYGDLDLQDTLKFINDEYLSTFQNKEIQSSVLKQKSFTERAYHTIEYTLPQNTDVQNKTYLSLNYAVDETNNKETTIGFSILNALLMQTESSPLRSALLREEMGINVFGSYNSTGLQTSFSIIIENANDQKSQDFEEIVQQTLEEIVRNGIDRELIDAIFNTLEISMRTEASNANRGLGYHDAVLNTWLYDHDPTLYLSFEDTLNSIKNKIDENYFENLIQEYLLDNTHSSLVMMKPVAGLEAEKGRALKAELQQIKDNFSEEEIHALVQQTKALEKWKETPNSEEAIQTLPKLSLDDLQQQQEIVKLNVEKLEEVTILSHPLFTNGIAYVNMYFDTTKVPQEQIPYISLLTRLLGSIDTENYSYQQLSNEMHNRLGGLNFRTNVVSNFKNNHEYSPKLIMSMYTVVDELENGFAVLEEMMHNGKFENVDRIKQLVGQLKTDMESSLNSNGIAVAQTQLVRKQSQANQYEASISGMDFYFFLCEIEEMLESNPKAVLENLKEINQLVFQKENLLVGITVDEDEYEIFKKAFLPFQATLKTVDEPWQTYSFTTPSGNEGIINAEQLQSVVKGANFKDLGYEYSGKMDVLTQILSTEYLWNQVRVSGGAYGSSIYIGDTGEVLLYSYRDPNLKETLDVFDAIPSFLRQFDADEEEMLNYIIGTLGEYDPLLSPQNKGAMQDMLYMTQRTHGDVEKIKEQILQTTAEDIRNFAQMMEDVLNQNQYVVVGDETKIQENVHLFDSVVNVFGEKSGAEQQIEYFPAIETFKEFGVTLTIDNENSENPIAIVEVENIKLLFYVNTTLIVINDYEHHLQGEIRSKDNEIYVPGEVFEIFFYMLQQEQ